MQKDKLDLLISKNEIEKVLDKLAHLLNADYQKKNVIIVSILKGSFLFSADLVRKLHFNFIIDFVRLSSYHNLKESTGTVTLTKDIECDIAGKHVLILEEILDSGMTLDFLLKRFAANDPLSVKICVLLDKKEKRRIPIHADYVGIEIEDKFVVGYGLDYQEKYRNLPDIYHLK
ncbi:MAG: hypoxanthine phosphoribosyltransferase [Deltaproteobacteria bacterium]|nr:hypoxanthine phosphoribosyltransferase [Deltaproteobacteria bacterium]